MTYRTIIVLALVGMAGPHLVSAAPQDTIFIEAAVFCPVLVRVPAGSAVKPPLLVVLHGRGDTAANMARIWEGLNDPKPILAVPEAPYPMFLSDDKGARLGGTWISVSHDRPTWERSVPVTIKYILDVIREIQKKYETGGVYILGHSQGVWYAYRAALQEPDLVKGVIAMAGYLEPESLPADILSKASGKVNVFIGHGKQDQGVDPDVSRQARAFLAERGYNVVLEEYEGGHSISWDIARSAQSWMMALERKSAGK